MGSKSDVVDYGFGQMGSMLVDGTSAFYPPKGMVIVAITSLSDSTAFNATNGLVSDLETYSDNNNSPWISTDADAHGTGEAAAQNGHTDGSSNADGVITLASADATIKPGMIVESATMCPRSLTNPYMVKSIDSTTLTVTKKDNYHKQTIDVAGELASGAAEPVYFFRTHGQGFGGVEMDASNTIPKGISIYGRWTAGKLAGGAVIVYFGV
tara:strand:- start:1742 stop:2374 length:633 start_codon:yes stop_codon:yes gene_type:complete